MPEQKINIVIDPRVEPAFNILKRMNDKSIPYFKDKMENSPKENTREFYQSMHRVLTEIYDGLMPVIMDYITMQQSLQVIIREIDQLDLSVIISTDRGFPPSYVAKFKAMYEYINEMKNFLDRLNQIK